MAEIERDVERASRRKHELDDILSKADKEKKQNHVNKFTYLFVYSSHSSLLLLSYSYRLLLEPTLPKSTRIILKLPVSLRNFEKKNQII